MDQSQDAAAPVTEADIHLIQRILPHRYPFLLVDRVRNIEGTQRAQGIKNVSINEPHFQGHFPGEPVMPGVTIIEAMAQTAGVMIGASMGFVDRNLGIYFMAIDGVKFRKPVEPGVLLKLEVEFVQKRSRVCKFAGKALLDGEVATECEFTAMIADPPKA